MRMLFVSIVAAPLMMIGALPAAQSISSDARIRLANGGPTVDRDPYNQNAPDAVLEWQKKLDDFTEKAKAKMLEEGKAVRYSQLTGEQILLTLSDSHNVIAAITKY
jgi:hypothetical protein